jgi:hypothetical protein
MFGIKVSDLPIVTTEPEGSSSRGRLFGKHAGIVENRVMDV